MSSVVVSSRSAYDHRCLRGVALAASGGDVHNAGRYCVVGRKLSRSPL